jgi:hypothetical protein
MRAEKDVADVMVAAEKETIRATNYVESAISNAITTAKKDVAGVIAFAEGAAIVTGAVVLIAAKAVVEGKGLATASKVVKILLQVPKLAREQEYIYQKVTSTFSSDALDNITSPCPLANTALANAARLSDAVAEDNRLIDKANKKGLGSDPKVQALQGIVNASVKALMSDDVYNNYSYPPQIEIPGYHRMSPTDIATQLGVNPAEFDTEVPNFHAALYVSDNLPKVYTLAFRGTDPRTTGTLVKDGITDAENALGIESAAYNSAIALAQEVEKAVEHTGGTLEVTGHSLGGGLAQAASSVTGAKGTIYNSAGLNPDSVPNFNGNNLQQNLVNYHVAGEPLTTAQNLVEGLPAAAARQVELPAPPNASLSDLHSMTSVETGLVGSGMESQSAVSKLVGGL